MTTTMTLSWRSRLLIALAIGLLAGSLCYSYRITFGGGAGDIGMPLCMGRALLNGTNPYVVCQGTHSDGITPTTANPMTTALVVLPLQPFPPSFAAALFFGLSTALLCFGLMRDGKTRLLVLLAYPYWQALQVVQWSPLLFAVALFPWLLPLALAKPHIGAPVILTNLTLRRLLACAAFIGISLIVDPLWPLRLLDRIGAPGDYRIPITVLPFGPILLLALLRWRSPRARFLFLLALVPQRTFYDAFLLWLVPQTRRELLVLGLLSWITYYGWFFTGHSNMEWVLACLYLPALIMVLRDSGRAEESPSILQVSRIWPYKGKTQ
ncbi:MAG: hypothetical protein KatS3mg057_0873 [Herpetosiphonaceae bacterium]|nr:MAG: hypothetical protein KatS3mg057_0873 [Herpetosiphonaceae bacterium]